MADFPVAIMSFVIFIYMAVLGIALLQYIFRSLALYRLAERRRAGNGALAWIPIADSYILGQITAEIDRRRMRKERKWGKTMLTLAIVGIGGFVLTYVFLFAFLLSITSMNMGKEVLSAGALSGIIIYFALIAAMLCLSALYVCRAICTYKIYEDIVPDKAIKYLIISIVVPLGEAVCLYRCRNLGYEAPPAFMQPPYPPYPPYQQYPQQPQPQPPTEPPAQQG